MNTRPQGGAWLAQHADALADLAAARSAAELAAAVAEVEELLLEQVWWQGFTFKGLWARRVFCL